MRRRTIALLLPALVLRALIPVGFMPMAGAGGVSLGLCPDAAAMPADMAGTDPAQPMHHGDHDAGVPFSGSHHAPCLFAASAGAGSTPAAVQLVAYISGVPQCALPAYYRPVSLPAVYRAQSARAPPQFS
jgi:hypothetical protein